MKRGFVVVLLLVSLCGHGFIVPTPRSSGADAASLLLSYLSVPVSVRVWMALWSDGKGEIRTQLTEPASPHLQSVYDDIVRRAQVWQFNYRPSTLYQTKVFVAQLLPDPPIRFYGRYFVGPNRILVNKEWTDQMTDEQLRVLLAHELGHAIDEQTERIGHPMFKSVYGFGRQEFADYIAGLLVSVESVTKFNRRYIIATDSDSP